MPRFRVCAKILAMVALLMAVAAAAIMAVTPPSFLSGPDEFWFALQIAAPALDWAQL
jgi:hypothetical protein